MRARFTAAALAAALAFTGCTVETDDGLASLDSTEVTVETTAAPPTTAAPTTAAPPTTAPPTTAAPTTTTAPPPPPSTTTTVDPLAADRALADEWVADLRLLQMQVHNVTTDPETVDHCYVGELMVRPDARPPATFTDPALNAHLTAAWDAVEASFKACQVGDGATVATQAATFNAELDAAAPALMALANS